MVPVGYNLGARRIRNAFLQSQRNRQTATLHVDNNMPDSILSFQKKLN
jgi:hypothetical protein